MNKKIILGASGAVSFLLFVILWIWTGHMASSLSEQSMAKRWNKEGGVSQISCFFSQGYMVTEDTIRSFEHSLDDYLKESSITVESANPGARLWADAYSEVGKIRITSDRGSLDADAVGIGGDFFLFHPQKLLFGSYFSGNDENHDYCILDEDGAWQLFGSNNVAGKMVYVSGVPHMVSGVIKRQDGRMAKAAGLNGTVVYVSAQTLEKYGSTGGINHYEIVMPSPVKEFAYKYVKEQLGRNEKETEILENTSRFSLINRLKVIGAFGTRSMNGKAIIYPYWENMARGYEDVIAALSVLMAVFLLYPSALLLSVFVIWWKHKGWTVKSALLKGKDKIDRFREKQYAARQQKRRKKE